MIRVVIVDDFTGLRGVMQRVLERHGEFRVVGTAGDGAEGVEVVRREQPDVVLLDLSMPRMDGLQALPLIRAAAPRAQIVVLSGYIEEKAARQAVELGAVRYLEKGLPGEDIVRALRQVLASSNDRREAPEERKPA